MKDLRVDERTDKLLTEAEAQRSARQVLDILDLLIPTRKSAWKIGCSALGRLIEHMNAANVFRTEDPSPDEMERQAEYDAQLAAEPRRLTEDKEES